MSKKANRRAQPCPCGRPATFDTCCGPYIDGRAAAPTAEALMRSRYTAYTLRKTEYLAATWHASSRPRTVGAIDNPRWFALDVIHVEATGADTATVEFVARYRVGGHAHRLHEISRFVREDGRWHYVDGDILSD